ncbi:hypothetical protein FA95DRAFT_1574811 [Auriscalpium vulgare]|uniref:Uncharacterized protein n=1 Tax=Auriscalpium vulgare TaxID=40419 RepID=A0ACB8RIQ7_9AGAM|nr:hypothetical protein FA95DRAFT_1574811 [Auriscalpium vulgare]
MRRADPPILWRPLGESEEPSSELEEEELEYDDGVTADSEAEVVARQSAGESVGRGDGQSSSSSAWAVTKTGKRKAKKVAAPVAVYPLVPPDLGKGKSTGIGGDRVATEAVAPAPPAEGDGGRGKGKMPAYSTPHESVDQENERGDNRWDSDFSEPSTPAATSSSSDSSRPPSVDPEIRKAIPLALQRRPVFPRNFIWTCPAEDCSYEVNLVALTEDNMLDLTPSDKTYLAGPWAAGDERLQTLWNDMVHRHLHVHLADLGIKVVPYRKWVKIEWIDPKLHRSRKVGPSALRLR